MRTRISWFVIGFVFSWCTWGLIGYTFDRPRDLSPSVPGSEDSDWLNRARARNVGGFTLIVDADSSGAEALLRPNRARFPATFYLASDDRSCAESVTVADSNHITVTVNDFDGDRQFDSMSFGTPAGNDWVSFTDFNLDGQYDQRMGPGTELAAMIDGQWRKLINAQGAKAQVNLNGKPTDVIFKGGNWRIDDSK